tara:strand:+ start:1687 stop:2244 length:558 start_codon:yes stop_codon:yes gene_type:complete
MNNQNPLLIMELNKKKIIIEGLLWVQENWAITNKINYEVKFKKIVETNKPINEAEKYGYKRTLKNMVNPHTLQFSGSRTLYFRRFSYCWDSLLKQKFTLPHRATYKTKNIKKRTNVLFNIWFKNMVKDREQKGEPLEEECPICYEQLFTGTIKTPNCNHSLCKKCYNKIMEKYNPKCPMCRSNLN